MLRLANLIINFYWHSGPMWLVRRLPSGLLYWAGDYWFNWYIHKQEIEQ